jgi:hypothetical protein
MPSGVRVNGRRVRLDSTDYGLFEDTVDGIRFHDYFPMPHAGMIYCMIFFCVFGIMEPFNPFRGFEWEKICHGVKKESSSTQWS